MKPARFFRLRTTAAILVTLICILIAGSTLPKVVCAKVFNHDHSWVKSIATPVFFVTDRNTETGDKGVVYGIERAPDISCGCLTKAGSSKVPDRKGKERLHEWITQFGSLTEFFDELRSAAKYSGQRVILFVPGYACSFEQAMYIGSHISASTSLPAIVFSWPSRNNVFAYQADECSAEWSSAQLSKFLKQLDQEVGNDKTILVAHSLGTRIVNWAIERSLAEGEQPSRKFSEILLCSPDMDCGVFSNAAEILQKVCADIRVYVSRKDLRLGLSGILHGDIRLGSARAQWCPPTHGVQVIDYTDADNNPFGHSIPFELIAEAVRPALVSKAEKHEFGEHSTGVR